MKLSLFPMSTYEFIDRWTPFSKKKPSCATTVKHYINNGYNIFLINR